MAPGDLITALCADGVGAGNSRRLLACALGRGKLDPEYWLSEGILPRRMRPKLSELPRLRLERRVVSAVDGFEKLVLATPDGLRIESVLIPLERPGCVSVCLSSQVGCVMGCEFCATARMTSRRNLETWEIIDQFMHAREIAEASGRRITGAVFMGMGEPFLNYNRVLAAAELLCFPVEGAIAGQAITISTVGIVREILRFTNERRPFRLSISLGAATDEKRARLVPVAARTPIAEVMHAARRHAFARNTRVNLAYVCIAGENMGDDDARELSRVVGDTPVRLDLIEVTDATGRFRRPDADEMGAFRDALRRHLPHPVARRYSGGADIQAACGTLAGASSAPSAIVL